MATIARSEALSVNGARSFGDVLYGRDNAFGLLRLVLASLVIVDHAFPLGGFGDDPMWRWSRSQDSIGGIAVAGFFVISGYLITRSAQSGDIVQYLWRRCLRIFPAFWGALLFSVLVICPLMFRREHGTFSGYFTTAFPGPWTYLTRNWTLDIGQYGLLDVYAQTPYGRHVGWSVLNGSLWTLTYEWRCYLIVGVLAVCAVLSRTRILVAVSALGLLILAAVTPTLPDLAGSLAPWFTDVHFVTLTMLFMLGAVAALYRDRIPFDDRLAVLAGVVWAWTLFHGGYVLIGSPALAYLMLWAAARIPSPIRRIASKNDYSYGIYVYGFFVQMTLADFKVYRLGLIPWIAIAWLITFLIAVLSWHLLEKRALRLKHWGPGRGWRHWLGALRSRRGLRAFGRLAPAGVGTVDRNSAATPAGSAPHDQVVPAPDDRPAGSAGHPHPVATRPGP